MSERAREQLKVTCRDIDGEITAQSVSDPSDLILDNFGFYLAAFFKSPINSNTQYTATDTAGAVKTFGTYSTGAIAQFNFGSAVIGSEIQLGSSVTAATRADFAIGTALGTAPESAAFFTGPGSYTAGGGIVGMSGTVVTGGAGTVNEGVLIMLWADTSGANIWPVAIFHDVLSSGVPYVGGNTLTAQWSIQL